MLQNQKDSCGFRDPWWELVVMAGDSAAHGGNVGVVEGEVADKKVVEDDIAGLGVSFWAVVADTSKDLWYGDVVMLGDGGGGHGCGRNTSIVGGNENELQ